MFDLIAVTFDSVEGLEKIMAMGFAGKWATHHNPDELLSVENSLRCSNHKASQS